MKTDLRNSREQSFPLSNRAATCNPSTVFSKVAISLAPRFEHVIPRINSIGYQIHRRYTTFGDGLQPDAGCGAGKLLVGNDLKGKEKPPTISQRMSLLEKAKFMISKLLGY